MFISARWSDDLPTRVNGGSAVPDSLTRSLIEPLLDWRPAAEPDVLRAARSLLLDHIAVIRDRRALLGRRGRHGERRRGGLL
jgi:hypothetical protein